MNTNTIAQENAVVELDSKAIEAVKLLRKAREMAETVKALEAEAKGILNEALTEGAHGVDRQGTVIVSRVSAKNTGVDSKKLKVTYPEAYEACYRETEYAKLVLPKQ